MGPTRDIADPPQQQQPNSDGIRHQSYMAEQQSYLQGVQEGNRSAETAEDEENHSTVYDDDDDDDDEVVPSDEVLFAAGWAKTLDPNSGSYYYFTLDRTQTVWDNPLVAPHDDDDDDDYSGSI